MSTALIRQMNLQFYFGPLWTVSQQLHWTKWLIYYHAS
jgi:hypothetical protein